MSRIIKKSYYLKVVEDFFFINEANTTYLEPEVNHLVL